MPPSLSSSSVVVRQSVSDFVLENELPSLDAAVERGKESMLLYAANAGAVSDESCNSSTIIDNNKHYIKTNTNNSKFSGNSNMIMKDICTCPHLLSIFPYQLNLHVVPKAEIDGNYNQQDVFEPHHNGYYYFKDPVSALHLHSQLEKDGSIHITQQHQQPLYPLASLSSSSSVSSLTATQATSAVQPQSAKSTPNFKGLMYLYGEEEERWNVICTEGTPDTYHPLIIPAVRGTFDSDNNDEIEDEDDLIDLKGNSQSGSLLVKPIGTNIHPPQFEIAQAKRQKLGGIDVASVPISMDRPLPSPPRLLGRTISSSSIQHRLSILPSPKLPINIVKDEVENTCISSIASPSQLPLPLPVIATTTIQVTSTSSSPSKVTSSDISEASKEISKNDVYLNKGIVSETVKPIDELCSESKDKQGNKVGDERQQEELNVVAPVKQVPSIVVNKDIDQIKSIDGELPLNVGSVAEQSTPPRSNHTIQQDGLVTQQQQQQDTAEFLLPDQTFYKYYKREQQIVSIQQNLLSSKRSTNKRKSSTIVPGSKTSSVTEHMQHQAEAFQLQNDIIHRSMNNHTNLSSRHSTNTTSTNSNTDRNQLKSQNVSTAKNLTSKSTTQVLRRNENSDHMLCYFNKQNEAITYSKLLLDNYVRSRKAFWFDKKKRQSTTCLSHSDRDRQNPILFRSKLTPNGVGFGSIPSNKATDYTSKSSKNAKCLQKLTCLECFHTGHFESGDNCHRTRPNEMQEHFLCSNHKFSVSCEAQPKIYCFECCKYVQHEVFLQEQHRIDLLALLPWMAWNDYGSIHRSFDALQFVNIPDIGIVWKGMKATYPIIVPKDHIRASRICLDRFMIFHGEMNQLPQNVGKDVLSFAKQQHCTAPANRYIVPVPIGMYNLGNTCFMSAILHCLVHCTPLQQYFIRDVGHNHVACNIYRSMNMKGQLGQSPRDVSVKTKAKMRSVCLACEMDKLFLRYIGSAKGLDVLSIADTSSLYSSARTAGLHSATSETINCETECTMGHPLLIADMLTAAWKCGGMNHLAGYEQRDAHEFLHGFLESLGKHARQYRERIHATINSVQAPKYIMNEQNEQRKIDDIKKFFEGSLRSVLVCLNCGSKRIQSESFMSISLPLSKEGLSVSPSTSGSSSQDIDIETCLRHFTMPEMLTDPVMCPHCDKKTPTKKQHVLSKLPKVLCLHLKRFDAGTNKKIEDFISFPCTGLNMGPFLPHWCEVSRVPSITSNLDQGQTSEAEITYDLYATVNHFGSLQAGHYVSNVKVQNKWFHCNDSFVGHASEAEILRSEGAYLLFYIRR